MFKKFASIQNRILIDYKRMKDHLTRKVQELQAADQEIKNYMDREEAESVHPSRAGSMMDRISTASILGGRKRSIIAVGGMETELPKILETPQTEAKSKLLSRSVLIDKHNLEKLKRYQAELSQASAKGLGSQRSASRGKESKFRSFQTPLNKLQKDEMPKSRLSEYSSASGLFRNQDLRMQQGLKLKIAYEWRNIQRQLQLQDVEGDGKVIKRIFERVVHEARTFLSREELVYIYRKYSDPLNEELLDYIRLSRDLALSQPISNLLDASNQRKSS